MNVDEALELNRSDEVHRLLAAEVRQLRAERGAWDQRMADLKAEFHKIDEVRNRQLERLRAMEQRAHVVHSQEPQNEHDHTMRGTAHYILGARP